MIATEVAKSGVASAHENLKAKNVTNVFVARLSSEEFTSAWKKERAFTRLQVQHCDRLQDSFTWPLRRAWAAEVAPDFAWKAKSRLPTKTKVPRSKELQQKLRCPRDAPASVLAH